MLSLYQSTNTYNKSIHTCTNYFTDGSGYLRSTRTNITIYRSKKLATVGKKGKNTECHLYLTNSGRPTMARALSLETAWTLSRTPITM